MHEEADLNMPSCTASTEPYRTERFEALRSQFHERLHQDRRILRRLGYELGRCDADATAVYVKLEMLAHRVAGAAALFEDHDVCNAAGSLEEAAFLAHRAHATHDDASVWRAVRALASAMPA